MTGSAVITMEGVMLEVTRTETGADCAVAGTAHPSDEVISQRITSLLDNELSE
jgi:hypothetical protein